MSWTSLLLSCVLTLPLALEVSAQSIVTTYAGNTRPVPGTQAISYGISPRAAAPDGLGGAYITSQTQGRVYHVFSDGTLQMVGGNARGVAESGYSGDPPDFLLPWDAVVDRTGNAYISDLVLMRIQRLSPQGVLSTVAGNGKMGFSGDGGPAIAASLNSPTALALDSAGNLYIADRGNFRVRKVSSDGVISTVATASVDSIAVDSHGNLYISGPPGYVVSKVSPQGVLTTFAGIGICCPQENGDGGPAIKASLAGVTALAVDAADNLYIAERHSRIRKVNAAGVIITIAGDGIEGYQGDNGLATVSELNNPADVSTDALGNVWIADEGNLRVRIIGRDGMIRTIAGNGENLFSGDGRPAGYAQLSWPRDVAIDKTDTLYIADTANNRVRKITADGNIMTVAGTGVYGSAGDGKPATAAELKSPFAIAVDSSGNLFIEDASLRILKVTTSGTLTTLFDGSLMGPLGGYPQLESSSIAVDAQGNLYTGWTDGRIRKITPGGAVSVVAGNGNPGYAGDDGPATASRLSQSHSLAIDAAGNIYIGDRRNYRLRKVSASDGIIRTIAGNGKFGFTGDGGPATSAQIGSIAGLVVDPAGNIYFADSDFSRIRKITPEGMITTVAGSSNFVVQFSGDGGPASSAIFHLTFGITLDSLGNLYVADQENFRIRKIEKLAAPALSTQTTFTIPDQGGASLTTRGSSSPVSVGYGRIQANMGNTTPAGLVIFGFRENNVLVTETSVPASRPIRSGRIYAEISDKVNTGLAIANPNGEPVRISYFFTDGNGTRNEGSTTIHENGQIAAFLNQPPFYGTNSFEGTFTFNSSAPVSAVALRSLINERQDSLLTTLPVGDLTATSSGNTVVVPHFADGGGWSTQILLVNTTDSPLTGNVQFYDDGGSPIMLTAGSQTASSFGYSIMPRGSQKLMPAAFSPETKTGSIRVVATGSTPMPMAGAIFAYRPAAVTVSEAGVPGVGVPSASRLYAETLGDFAGAAIGSIQSGIAASNVSNTTARLTLELMRLDGSSTGLLGSVVLPPNGHFAGFLNQISGFAGLPSTLQAVLRVSSSSPFSVIGLRSRYNERNEFLITTTPPVDESAPALNTELLFPHYADGGGYTTQFVLFSGFAGQSTSGILRFVTPDGNPMTLSFRQ